MAVQRFTNKSDGHAPVDTSAWQAIPDPHDTGRRGSELWVWDRHRCQVQVDPADLHGNEFIVFPYAVSVFDSHGRLVACAALEQTDYRVLSRLTGERQSDYGGTSKSRFSEVRAVLFLAGERREYGVYESRLELQPARDFLFELVADGLDLTGDALPKGLL